jgi:hypothetical protein
VSNFLIGVWYQPFSSHATWKARGINTLWGYEHEGHTVTYSTWKAAATAQGLKYIVQWADAPGGTPYLSGADDSDPNLLAVAMPDEPDGNGYSVGQILDMSLAAKAALPSKPIAINFAGSSFQSVSFANYRCYAQAADWLGYDDYPCNGHGDPNFCTQNTSTGWIKEINYLKQMGVAAGGAKRYHTFIECSDQNLKVQSWLHAPENQPQGEALAALMRAPTMQEMGQQVAVAVKNGLTGVFYFPQKIGGSFVFDNTTSETQDAMKTLNAFLAQLNA